MSLTVLLGTMAATILVFGLDLWLLRALALKEDLAAARGIMRRHLARITPGGAAIAVVATQALLQRDMITLAVAVAAPFLVVATALFMMASLAPLGGAQLQRYLLAVSADSGVAFFGAILLITFDLESVAACVIVMAAGKLLGAAFGATTLQGASRKPTRDEYRSALRYGAPSAAGALLTFALYRMDALLLGVFASATEVGLYVTAAAVMEFVWVLPDSLAQLLVGHVRYPDGGAATARATRVSVAVVAGVGLSLALAGAPLMTALFGPAYVAASACLGPLAAASILFAIWKILVFDLAGRGDTKTRAISSAAAVVTMIAADVLLIPKLGIRGAAVASATGYGVAALIAIRRWSLVSGCRPQQLVLLHGEDLRRIISSLKSCNRDRIDARADR